VLDNTFKFFNLALLAKIREIGSVYPASDYCGTRPAKTAYYSKIEVGAVLEVNDVY
jgi:hypothetical protein